MSEDQSTGIKGADEFRAEAQKLGLNVETRVTEADAVVGERSGQVILPACTNVMLTVTIPVPVSLGNNALTLEERNTELRVCWKRDHNGRARGRWILGNYSTLGGHQDMHMLTRCRTYLDIMAHSAAQLRRFADEG